MFLKFPKYVVVFTPMYTCFLLTIGKGVSFLIFMILITHTRNSQNSIFTFLLDIEHCRAPIARPHIGNNFRFFRITSSVDLHGARFQFTMKPSHVELMYDCNLLIQLISKCSYFETKQPKVYKTSDPLTGGITCTYNDKC